MAACARQHTAARVHIIPTLRRAEINILSAFRPIIRQERVRRVSKATFAGSQITRKQIAPVRPAFEELLQLFAGARY